MPDLMEHLSYRIVDVSSVKVGFTTSESAMSWLMWTRSCVGDGIPQ